MSINRPNILLVITDDQGYGDLACHGNPIVKTPNIDAMYAESVRLTNFHVGPVCAPTRAGLLTGRYANSTGVWDTAHGRSHLRRDEATMADIFARNGYATGIFGKWHLGDNYPYRPEDRGFQEVITHGGGIIGNTADYWGNDYFDDTYWTQDGYQPYEGYCTDVWFREAMRFIERHRHEPFFCYVPTNAPHAPHLVEPRYSDPYLDKTPNRDRANYYGMISNIDENFAILRRKVAELGLAENTILIFMTDNGSAGGVTVDADQFVVDGYNAGMRGKKASEYDGGHRVPFFLHWPGGGFDRGCDISTLTANIDILPTLMELCGVSDVGAGYEFDGKSLVSLLNAARDGKPVEWDERTLVTDMQSIFSPVKWRKCATMTNRWRLINGVELYDMEADPGQRNDVASQYPEIVEQLRHDYEAWWERVSSRFGEEIPITVGDPQSTSVVLNSHDWRTPGVCVWNQNQVRQGMVGNGYWELWIAESGTYRIELRRWPKEEDRAIVEGIPDDHRERLWRRKCPRHQNSAHYHRRIRSEQSRWRRG
jgi:arylsulfatase A-like enzyme